MALTTEGEGRAEDDPAAAAFDLREWLRGENLWDVLTPDEVAFLAQPVGHEMPVAFDTWSLGESLATLAWTLGLIASVEPHLAPDFATLIDAIPSPWDATSSWVASQRLRPELEIATERERAELWEWRLATEIARRAATAGELGQIESAIFDVTYEAEQTGLLGPRNVQGDYELWKAIGELEDEAIASSRLFAEHRLRALNWVCGFGDRWDSVPLDI
jgi:hypothetical protein